MINLVFYFQVHQPYRIRNFSVLDIGKGKDYFDDELNGEIMRKVAKKCYLPTNKLLLDLIDKYEGKFRIAYSITGTAIEQFKKYAPEVLYSFRDLAKTNCVEFLGETYYHSLAFLYDKNEFLEQTRMHKETIQKEFGFSPITFRNTELIYQDSLSDYIWEEEGYKVILTEGVDRILQWRSPLYAYKNWNKNLYMLLKFYSLSDDIAFRFSNKGWVEYPLTVDKFVKWILDLNLIEKGNKNLFLNLFMDYETFGEHQWEDTGIFEFMKHLPAKAFKSKQIEFSWPSDVLEKTNYQPESISFPEPVSWADMERDLSAWRENDMQHNALETFYDILQKVKATGNPELLEMARKLSTSDHFYYMSTKYFQDGDVHKYFSPYGSPETGYNNFMNAVTDLEERI
ncbi:MAG: glycoside hydrolase family 57 protein [Candidatus Delongbacteria bacterium]|nr:glycoside hydrolase family 57 protein [Candidatus Delongbacteria bacterium]MCG2761378.1 glycoside hydrolase family 57 protein [Candidatus Delongbacteria bacterium]